MNEANWDREPFTISVDSSIIEEAKNKLKSWVDDVRDNADKPTGKITLRVNSIQQTGSSQEEKNNSNLTAEEVSRLADQKNANFGIVHLLAVKHSVSLKNAGLRPGQRILFPGTVVVVAGSLKFPGLRFDGMVAVEQWYEVGIVKFDPEYNCFLEDIS